MRALIEEASREARRGVGWGMDRLVVVGRKGGVGVVGGEEGEGGKVEEDGVVADGVMSALSSDERRWSWWGVWDWLSPG